MALNDLKSIYLRFPCGWPFIAPHADRLPGGAICRRPKWAFIKKCAGTASSCDFLRETVRNSDKRQGNSVKNYPCSSGNTQNVGVWGEKKSGIFVFFGCFGASPHYSGLRGKKVRKTIFFDRQWVQTIAKPLFIEIEIEKKSIFDRKNSTPNYPEICYLVPGPPAVHGSGGAH